MTAYYNDTYSIGLSPAVELSRAVAVVSGLMIDKNRSGFAFKLSADNQLDVEVCNYDNTYGNFEFYWQVYELEDAVVQHGEVTIATASGMKASGTISVNHAPMDKSFLVFSGFYMAGINSVPNAALGQTAADTLSYQVFQISGAAQNVIMPWQLVTLLP
jgi:hypothetical protein